MGLSTSRPIKKYWILCVLACVFAPPALSTAEAVKSVRVGLYENAPKIYTDPDGEPAGLFITLIREIARKESWALEFVPCRWWSCLEQLEAGSLDLMPDVAFNDARSLRFDFHGVPVTHSWSVILKRADTPKEELTRLHQRRIAVLAGAVQGSALARMMAGRDLDFVPVKYPSFADAFAAVREGEADAVAANNIYAAYFAQRYNLRETPVVFDPATLYYATTKGDPKELLPRIDAWLETWRYDEDSMYYAALKQAMIPAQKPVVPPVYRYLVIGIGAMLLLFLAMSGVLRWQVRRRTTQLQETGQRLDHLLQSSPVVLYQLSVDDGQISTSWISENVERIYGFSATGFVSEDMWPRQLHPDDRDAVLNNAGALADKDHLVQEYRVLDARGVVRTVRDEMQFVPGNRGKRDEIVGSWNDLTVAREQAAQLRFLSHYDPLTRLPNRALLRERLSQAITRARQQRRSMAVLYMDIDRFKHINDSFGRPTGDRVLKATAERLVRLTGAGYLLARIGGDGFVLLIEDSAGPVRAEKLAREVITGFAEPITLSDRNVALTVSVGISLFPDDSADPDTLLQNAEAAMYEAKRAGRSSRCVYSSSLAVGMAERLSIETALRGAIRDNELVLHYQPQVELANGGLVGAEALVRWQHPQLGLLPPSRFIPVAEEMGIISDVGAWVLREACRQMMAWRTAGAEVPRVAVNLAAPEVDSETLLPLVRRVLDETGLDGTSLEVEITESIIMSEPERSARALEGLRAMGIRVAIDDFGTGYSSLSYLKHLPIDRLKIDRSFVSDVVDGVNSRAVSRAIIGLARSLELETIAEGIEETAQLDFLRREGCAMGQGFLFSAAVPAEELAGVVQKMSPG